MNVPVDVHAEQAALGSVLLNPEALHDLTEVLGPSGAPFYDARNTALFEAMVRIQARGETPDVTTVLSEVGDKAPGVDVAYLSALVSTEVSYTSARAAQYAAAVRNAHTRRQLLESCRRLSERAGRTSEPIEEVLDALGATHTALTSAYARGDAAPLGACVEDALGTLQRMAEADGQLRGVPSGMAELDALTGGWMAGDLVIVAARPSVGKTAFALNVAHHAAHCGTPVYFASLEMERQQLVQRLLCLASGARMDRFTSGWRANQALEDVASAAPVLADLPVTVDDTPRMTLWELEARVRRWRRKHEGGLIVVDYLQLLRTGRRFEKRYLEVGEISAGLKALGRELGCPVIALCQLSREAERERDGFRMLACLREAGSLEQDADLVLILTRLQDEEIADYERDHGAGACNGLLPAYVAKHRNGPTGRVFLRFDKANQRMGEWA